MNRPNEFFQKIFRYSIITNITGGLTVFALSSMYVYLRPAQILHACLISISGIFAMQFLLFRFVLKKQTFEISEQLFDFYSKEGVTTVEERTSLLVKLLRLPMNNLWSTAILALSLTLALCLIYHYYPPIGLDSRTAFISYIACIFGSFNLALFAHTYSEHICYPHAVNLVRKGIDMQYLREKRIMGLSMKYRGILYLMIPAAAPNIINFILLLQGYEPVNNQIFTPKVQIIRIIIISILSFTLSLTLWLLYYMNVRGKTRRLIFTIVGMLKNPKANNFADTSLSDELQLNINLINTVIGRFRELVHDAQKTGEIVLKTTDNLSVISNQVNSTSLEQSADVKAILTTMEDANALSQNIANKILHVSGDAETTKTDIQRGLDILHQNISQMEQINESNTEILNGINNLTQQIKSIDDVVDIINDIADQTRIIAFNAELEAVSAGDEGKNFHIVATEIRRLAASTMDSIHEIQTFIKTIQDASTSLIESSQNETFFIQQEKELSSELEEQFNSISESSNQTFTKATEIAEIVDQQTSAFNQIVITLKQISAGIESFTVSTKTISETAGKMKNIASSLNSLEHEKI